MRVPDQAWQYRKQGRRLLRLSLALLFVAHRWMTATKMPLVQWWDFFYPLLDWDLLPTTSLSELQASRARD